MRPPLSVPTLSRRARIILIAIAALVVLITALGALSSVLVDYWWFQESDFTSVFWTQLQTRALLFLIFGTATGLLVAANIVLAYRMRPPFRPMSAEQQNLERYRSALDPRHRLIVLLAGVVLALFAGFTAQGDWKIWLLWRNSTDFGTTDPQFHIDISFFAFDLPFYRFALGFGFAIILLSLAGAAIVHYLYGGIRLQTPGEKFTSGARVHLSVLLGLFVLLKAVAYWLDRYDLLFSDRGPTTGASYTDVNAVLPAKTILVFVAIICAVAFFANIVFRNFALPAISLVLLIVASLVIGGAYPAIIDRFQVKPNADQLEKDFITRSIDATRAAYGITGDPDPENAQSGDTVQYQRYEVKETVPPAEITADTGTIPNVRLLDPNVISAVVQQTQQVRNIYGFPDKLDIDRYTIDGKLQDYIVAVRELESANLTGNQTNWINQHLVYTHGYGLIAAPANQVGDGGVPEFVNSGFGDGLIPVEQPRIYYGELMDDYSIVGAPAGSDPREFDRPAGEEGELNNTYDGSGGISVGSFFRQLVFAVNFRESNFILNSEVGNESKVLYIRDPRERVEKAAPFLQVDGDPYPAVVDGRIVWIVDGYTTSAGYPYSQQETLGDVARDSLTGRGTQALPDETVNYIRNSVKATVDAYDGTVTLYQFDDKDPVLKTWMKAFPGTIESKSEIPAELAEHFRYPEDLFKIQRSLLSKYHVTNPVDFFNEQDFWRPPTDPTQDTTEDQPPFYVLSQVPGEEKATFQLTSVLSVQNQDNDNLKAYVAASSDPEDYGTIRVLTMPQDVNVLGPNQVQSSFRSTDAVSRDISLFDSGGSRVFYGNLLTLPVAGGLLYVEPLYVQGRGSTAYPTLRKVLLSFGGKVAYEDTMQQALDSLFGPGAGEGAPQQGDGTTPPDGTPPPTTPPAGSTSLPGQGTTITPELAQALADQQAAQKEYEAANTSGDYAAAGAALEKWITASEKVQQLLTGDGAAASSSPGG